MPYELTVTANRQDPSNRAGRAERVTPVISTMLLAGTLDADASAAVLAKIVNPDVAAAHSIVVEFGDVDVSDRPALDALLHGLMKLREEGIEVQIFAPSASMHERMERLPGSRDWLIGRSSDVAGLPRKSLHLDGPAS